MEQLVGRTLGRYRLDKLLGEGGMGAVFKAQDITLQRDVAVKILHPHIARRPDFRERFLQEARTAARLSHPGIVKVFDFGQEASHLYIVMEFIAGANLRQLMQDLRAEGRWMMLDESVRLLREVALALDYAHDEGILHRDIKPDNIMLRPDRQEGGAVRPVITDLGLAKLADGGIVTAAGVAMGTPAYMSPEQAQGRPTDARSDVYSLGVLLFELATGQLPFPARTITEAIRYHTQEPPPRPRSLRTDLPGPLEHAILQAMAKDPVERFHDAGAMAEALNRALERAPLAAEPASAPPSAPAGAVSLVTRYRQSLLDTGGPSVLERFPEPPPGLAMDRITVLLPDGTTQSVAIGPEGLTIGRAPDNALSLDDTKASRYHAQVHREETRFTVTDLNSTNGTFLGSTKLLPGVPEPWTPDQPLRIGGAWLRLELAAAPVAPVPPGDYGLFRTDGTVVPAHEIQSSAGEGRVGLFMENRDLSVTPGQSVTASLSIVNQGPVVDSFRTTVEGIPPDWLPAPPPSIRLLPGASGFVTVTILPPRSGQTRAGRHPVVLRVASVDVPSQVAQVQATLSVGVLGGFQSELHPERIHAGKPAQVTVQNLGNAPQTFALAWQDRADELAFDPAEAQLPVPPGQSASARFVAVPKRRRWAGGDKTHPISARVTAVDGESRTHGGEVISRGRFPTWLLAGLAVLLVAGAAGLGLGISGRSKSIARATATREAEQTQTAGLDAVAMTATAAADADGDGLTYAQELARSTNPDDADSDDDGISDGDEVNGWQAGGETYTTDPTVADSDGDTLADGDERKYGSDPHLIDTDGDTLSDGEEVHGWKRDGTVFYTNPTSRDTDNDGQPDQLDDDPGQLPTPTWTPTSTLTPSPTPTETPTPSPTPSPTPTRAQNVTAPFAYRPGGYLERALQGEYAGTTVTILGFETGVDADYFTRSMELLTEYTGIEVHFEGTRDWQTILPLRVEAGDAPDLASFPSLQGLATFARQGFIQDISSYIPDSWLSQQYDQSWLDMATLEGPGGPMMTGLWHRFTPYSLIWYARSTIEAMGYEVDPTWIGLKWMSDAAVEEGLYPWCVGIESGAATGWVAARWLEAMMLRSAPLSAYDLWAEGGLPFDSSQVRTAANYIGDFWFGEGYVLGGRRGIVSTSIGDAPAPLFKDPPDSCWLHMQGTFITGYFPAYVQYGVDYGVYALPQTGEAYGAPMLVSGSLVAQYNDRDEVRAVMEYLTTPESVSGWLEAGTAFSPHRTVTPEMYGTRLARDIAALVSEADGFRTPAIDMMGGSASSCAWEGLTAWVEGALTLEEALASIDGCIR